MQKLTHKDAIRYFGAKSRNVVLMFKDGDIQTFEDKRVKKGKKYQTVWIDNRTTWKITKTDKAVRYPVILPFAIQKSIVYIICPYCGAIHVHSNNEGFRVSHCKHKNNQPEYFIKKINKPVAKQRI